MTQLIACNARQSMSWQLANICWEPGNEKITMQCIIDGQSNEYQMSFGQLEAFVANDEGRNAFVRVLNQKIEYVRDNLNNECEDEEELERLADMLSQLEMA